MPELIQEQLENYNEARRRKDIPLLCRRFGICIAS